MRISRQVFAVVIAAVLSAIAGVADAQVNVRDVAVKIFVRTVNGIPMSCGVEYDITFSDGPAHAGKAMEVAGSLSWASDSHRRMGLLIKTMGGDMTEASGTVPFRIEQGVIEIDGKPVLPISTVRCGHENEFCGWYRFEHARAVYTALSTAAPDSVSVAFARHRGEPLVVVPLNAPADDGKDWSDCMATLSNGAGMPNQDVVPPVKAR